MFKVKNIGLVNVLIILILITFIIPPQILNPIFLGMLLAVVIIRHIIFKKYFFRSHFNTISLLFILYFLLMLMSLLYTQDLKKGFSLIGGSISFLIIPLIPLFISKEEINLTFIAKSYIAFLCFIFLLLVSIGIYKNINEGYTLGYIYNSLGGAVTQDGKYNYFNYWYFAYDKFVSSLKIQPIYLGLFTNVGLVFLLFLKEKIRLSLYYMQLVVLGLLILFVASRSQILIFGFNYLLFTVFFDKSKPLNKILSISSIVIVFLVISLINPVTKTRLKESINFKEAFYEDDFGGASIRIKKWESAVKCIEDSPIFGYGIGDSKNELLEQYKRDKFYLGFYNKYNAHNQYLDTILSFGVFGIALLLLIFYFAYKFSINSMCLLLITNIFSIGFLTESMLNRQWGIMAFSFFLIMFSSLNLGKNGN